MECDIFLIITRQHCYKIAGLDQISIPLHHTRFDYHSYALCQNCALTIFRHVVSRPITSVHHSYSLIRIAITNDMICSISLCIGVKSIMIAHSCTKFLKLFIIIIAITTFLGFHPFYFETLKINARYVFCNNLCFVGVT